MELYIFDRKYKGSIGTTVYDGHGGHEVATYCSQKLPEFIKNTEAYKAGDIKQALIDAFLACDSTLATPEVMSMLKKMAGGKFLIWDKEEADESDVEENVNNLCMEATMPLDQVIAKSQAQVSDPSLANTNNENCTCQSQFPCPYLRSRRNKDRGACSSSGAGCSTSSSSWNTNEADVSSSSQPCESASSSSKRKIVESAGSSEADQILDSTTSNGDVSGIPQVGSSADSEPTQSSEMPDSSEDIDDNVSPSKIAQSSSTLNEAEMDGEKSNKSVEVADSSKNANDNECSSSCAPLENGEAEQQEKISSSGRRRNQMINFYSNLLNKEVDYSDDDDDDDDENDQTFDGQPERKYKCSIGTTVYDGHGGHEVATYCSQKLPEFIKNTEAYKAGDIKQALIDAFLAFDSTLATPEVMSMLKKMAGGKFLIWDKEEADESENVNNLCMEATMPLDQVIAKSQAHVSDPSLANTNNENCTSQSQFPSPYLRSRRNKDRGACSSSGAGCSTSSSSWNTNEGNVSSSSQPCESSSSSSKRKIVETAGSSEADQILDSTTSNGDVSGIPQVGSSADSEPTKSSEMPDSSEDIDDNVSPSKIAQSSTTLNEAEMNGEKSNKSVEVADSSKNANDNERSNSCAPLENGEAEQQEKISSSGRRRNQMINFYSNLLNKEVDYSDDDDDGDDENDQTFDG